MDYIDIDKNELPVRFDINLADETFTMEMAYNETGDFFTVDLYRPDAEGELLPLVLGEKLTLNRRLWESLTDLELPAPSLVPMDLSNREQRLSFANFGVTVFLFVDNGGDEDAEL